jgi:hypothetical protein
MTELANRCAAVVQRNGARVSTSLSIRRVDTPSR